MSRIGKLPISIPAGVTVTLKENVVNVKGPKGELSQFVNPAIIVEVADGHVVLKENEEAMLDNLKQRHAFHCTGVGYGYQLFHKAGRQDYDYASGVPPFCLAGDT